MSDSIVNNHDVRSDDTRLDENGEPYDFISAPPGVGSADTRRDGYMPTPEERPDLYAHMIAHRTLPDGRLLFLEAQVTNHRLCVTSEIFSVDEAYTYNDTVKAIIAYSTWDGTSDPEGWVRHTPSNRRRPEGDPLGEYIRE